MNKEPFRIICLTILLLASFLLDPFIHTFFLSLQSPPLTSFFLFISRISDFLGVLILGTIIFTVTKKYKELKKFWIILFLIGILVYLLKHLINRPRPIPQSLEQDPSFPSGHATANFTAYSLFSSKSQKVWLLFALLACISRLYLGVHYLSDIVAGIILGLYLPELFLKLLTSLQKRNWISPKAL